MPVSVFRAAGVGAAYMIALVLVAAGGCTGGGSRQPVLVDSLATDRERLMLVRYLPPGIEEREVRRSLPALGSVDTATGVATQPFILLGQPATLETRIRSGFLERCGYRISCTDSVMAAFLYRELQRSYTAELGNYHEEFGDAVHPARSFWSSGAYGLVLTLAAGDHRYNLTWYFESLPPQKEQPAPAAGNSMQRQDTIIHGGYHHDHAPPLCWTGTSRAPGSFPYRRNSGCPEEPEDREAQTGPECSLVDQGHHAEV